MIDHDLNCASHGPMGSIAVWRILRALEGDSDD